MHLDIFDVFISDEYTSLMSISPYLAKLLNYMDRRIRKDVNNITLYSKNDPKISMNSEHDTNLAAFLVFLRAVFNNRTELLTHTFAKSV